MPLLATQAYEFDHLLLSPGVAKRSTAAGVDTDVRGWEKSSDHAPTWIELRSARKGVCRESLGLLCRGQCSRTVQSSLPPWEKQREVALQKNVFSLPQGWRARSWHAQAG